MLASSTAQCSICLNLMIKGSPLFTTACDHTFHFECINSVKANVKECPLCRNPMCPLTNIVTNDKLQRENVSLTIALPLHFWVVAHCV
ncbi:unnamed protein product, partial [Didymodactylos carnosus]